MAEKSAKLAKTSAGSPSRAEATTRLQSAESARGRGGTALGHHVTRTPDCATRTAWREQLRDRPWSGHTHHTFAPDISQCAHS